MVLHIYRESSRAIDLRAAAWGAWACLALASTALGQVPPRTSVAVPPTYSRDIAPILRAKCVGCHRKGQVAPFALETYEQSRKRAGDIASIVGEKRMPPWKPAADIGPKLHSDRSLTAAEIATIHAWSEAGAPKGNAEALPPLKTTDGWSLGIPDRVIQAAEDFIVPASGPDLYRCFVIPTDLPEDVYVAAVEYRPGNRRVVHHMSAFLDGRGIGRKMDEAEPGPGYISFTGPGFMPDGELGFWTTGNIPRFLPDGVAIAVPKQSDVILQIHYHPSGKPEPDRTQIGLYFARKPVKQTLHWNDASNNNFYLPAGLSNIEVKGGWYVPVDLEALAVSPHMHQLGSDMRLSVTYPDQSKKDLIFIPEWDQAWQDTYHFESPVALPKGSMVNVVAHYDNSASPRNHTSPPKHVRSGHGVTDEMCVGYIAVVKKGQDLTRPGEINDMFKIFAKQRALRYRTMLRRNEDRK